VKTPYKINDSWTFEYETKPTGGIKRNYKAISNVTEINIEKTTRAGKFRSDKIINTQTGMPHEFKKKYEYWYSEEVGAVIVAKGEWDDGTTYDSELVEFGNSAGN